MKRIPTDAEKKRVYGWIRKWMPRLLLNAHAVAVNFSAKPRKTNNQTAAMCYTKTPYMDVTLTIYPIFWTESRREQERIILHELLHVIAQASKDAACSLHGGTFVTWREIEAANETLVDTLTNVLWLNA